MIFPVVGSISARIIEQRKVDLVAHRGNIGLVEQEFGGMSPALAVLGPLMRQRDNVVGSPRQRCAEQARP
jgi:hypothetical protein